jgi:N-acetylmuramoyl-L-alanine amidase
MRLLALLCLMLVIPTTASAQTERRIALLIGNQAYSAKVGLLQNPHNDVAAVGAKLQELGFEISRIQKDASRVATLGAVREFVKMLNAAGPNAVGFFYYSGHGAADAETRSNYLIPIDATDPRSSSFWDESVKVDDLLRIMDGAEKAAKFVVLDACRNELKLPTKSTSKGLLPVTQQNGMFIAYASAPGQTASDAGRKTGPYAEALVSELGRSGLDHLGAFQNVKEAVFAKTGGGQHPWESNGLLRRVYFAGEQQKRGKPVVVIDAGHGGIDTGTYAFGVFEKDLMLDYGLKIAEAIKKTGAFEVKLTRSGDDFVPLDRRIALVKEHKALLFISLHADSTQEDTKESGVTIYVKKSSLGEEQGAQSVSSVFARLLGGYLGAQSMNKSAFREAEFRVLDRASPETMAILVELGFLSNQEDTEKLKSVEFRDKIVSAFSGAAQGVVTLSSVRN